MLLTPKTPSVQIFVIAQKTELPQARTPMIQPKIVQIIWKLSQFLYHFGQWTSLSVSVVSAKQH